MLLPIRAAAVLFMTAGQQGYRVRNRSPVLDARGLRGGATQVAEPPDPLQQLSHFVNKHFFLLGLVASITAAKVAPGQGRRLECPAFEHI